MGRGRRRQDDEEGRPRRFVIGWSVLDSGVLLGIVLYPQDCAIGLEELLDLLHGLERLLPVEVEGRDALLHPVVGEVHQIPREQDIAASGWSQIQGLMTRGMTERAFDEDA